MSILSETQTPQPAGAGTTAVQPGVPFAGPVRPGGEAGKEGPSVSGGQDIPPHPNGPDQPDSATRDGGPRTGSAGEGASVSPPPIFQGGYGMVEAPLRSEEAGTFFQRHIKCSLSTNDYGHRVVYKHDADCQHASESIDVSTIGPRSSEATVHYVEPWVVPLVLAAATVAALPGITSDEIRQLRRAVDNVPTITPTLQRLRPDYALTDDEGNAYSIDDLVARHWGQPESGHQQKLVDDLEAKFGDLLRSYSEDTSKLKATIRNKEANIRDLQAQLTSNARPETAEPDESSCDTGDPAMLISHEELLRITTAQANVLRAAKALVDEIRADNRTDEEQEELCRTVDAYRATLTGGPE